MSTPHDQFDQLGDDHFRCEVVIDDPMGLHVRPASQVAKLALESRCSVTIHTTNRTVDCTSILDLITLAAGHKSQLRVEAKGEDALQTLVAVAEALERKSRSASTSCPPTQPGAEQS